MSKHCKCKEWEKLNEAHDLFAWDPSYGWVIRWIQLTQEKGYDQVHRYGVPIKFCPICGQKLEDKD